MRFIKYNPDSEMSKYLRSKPLANHLANIIASRVRRTDCKFTGLKKGQCFLGDFKKIGLTEQQYRTAKKLLKKIDFATFKGTNKGTVATLVNMDVWDVNIFDANGQTNRQTTDKPTDKQRLTKNVKNTKNENKYTHLELFKNFQKGKEIRRTQLDKNFNFALFPAEYSDNLKNEILKYFKYLESKKGDNWGVLGTLSSQLSVLKSYYNKFPEAEIIEALNDTQSRGNVSYNPEWTKNRKEGQRETKPTKQNNHSSDGTPSYMMGLKY